MPQSSDHPGSSPHRPWYARLGIAAAKSLGRMVALFFVLLLLLFGLAVCTLGVAVTPVE
ncbi:MAG: hypothetical protein AAGI53_09415 [Planctomycetota bacterium]